MLERDIEDAFIAWLPKSKLGYEYLGRQVRVGDGILDVLCYAEAPGAPVVVEVKLGRAPKSVFAQLCSYMDAVDYITSVYGPDRWDGCNKQWTPDVRGCIVAEDLDDMTHRAIALSHVRFIRYTVTEAGAIRFTDEQIDPPYLPDKPSEPLADIIDRITVRHAKEQNRAMFDRTDFEGGKYLPHLLRMEKDSIHNLPRGA